MRGALRTSRTRGGMRWTRKARETHAPEAYGEVAWFGRRGAGAKLAIRSAGDGGKRAVLREEREVSRKATAQGRPGCSVCTCMLVCIFLSANRTRDRGCSKHPVFPAPSIQEEGDELQNLGRNAPRDRGGVDDGCHRNTRNVRANSPDERSDIRDNSNIVPDIAALIRATLVLIVARIASLLSCAPTKLLSLFWRQPLNTPGVAAGTHSGLKRAVARESAALFTDLPQMRVEL